MKPLIIIASVLTFIIVFGMLSLDYLHTESKILVNHLDKLEMHVTEKSWLEAEKSFEVFNKKWSSSSKNYLMLIAHKEVDSINISLSELGAYINNKEPAQAQAKLAALRILLEHLPEKESLTLKNIF
ncbi:MAG: DUF4363 family protein [Bacillota bacterium]